MKAQTLWSALCASLLALGALCAAVLIPAMNGERFAEAVRSEVSVPGLSDSVKDVFARETAAYLNGQTERWNVDEPLSEAGIPVSGAFRVHMAEMRCFVFAGRAVCHGALLAGAVLFVLLWRKWSRRGWVAGLLLWPTIAAAAGLWCAVDFRGFWWTIHRVFIPGGIFPASEPLMDLFPLSLFRSYVLPVTLLLAGFFLLLAAVLFLIPKKKESES